MKMMLFNTLIYPKLTKRIKEERNLQILKMGLHEKNPVDMEVRMETNHPLNISNWNLLKEGRPYGIHEKKKNNKVSPSTYN